MSHGKRETLGYWSLVGAGEPFRLLFPVGWALALLGVVIWPLFVLGWWPAYPAIAHPRIMVEGFLTAYVVGFLGTALPRLLEVPRISLRVSVTFAGLLVGTAALHAIGQTLAGDLVFVATLSLLFVVLAIRLPARQDTPPPGFVLVALGLLSALAGAISFVLAQTVPLPTWAYSLGPLLLYQTFLLLPILGIGSFLLPRFLGAEMRKCAPGSTDSSAVWRRGAAFAAGCGLAIIASFAIEAFGYLRIGCALRAGVILLYFWHEIPMHRARSGVSTLAVALRVALFSVPLGYLLIAGWPDLRTAWLHVVFIAGFSLLVFTVASRVVLGHSGQSERFRAPLRSVLVMTICLLAATLTRIVADFMPAHRLPHLSYAAILWLIGAMVWGFAMLPSVRKPDLE